MRDIIKFPPGFPPGLPCLVKAKQTRAGKLTGLMLLLNIFRKMSLPWLEGLRVSVTWLLHLGQIKFNNRRFLQSLTQRVLTWHWGIDLIWIFAWSNVLRESHVSVSAIIHPRHTEQIQNAWLSFWNKAVFLNSWIFRRRKKGLSDSSDCDCLLHCAFWHEKMLQIPFLC